MTPPPLGPGVPGNAWDMFDERMRDAQTRDDGMHDDPVRDERMHADPPLVSVIVVHYAQPDDLTRTLRSLARQTYPRLEVIVVDDGSPVPPQSVPDGVQLILLPDRGFRAAAARNAGAARASGEVLCFLDADTAPEPEYVARLTRLPLLLPEAVTVGHRLHADFPAPPTEAPVEVLGPLHELPEPAWLRDAYAASRNLLDADQHSYRFLIGAVLCCSRWFFAEAGGFDERFDRYGGEDWEWAHRAWTSGAVFAHVPDAIAWHNGPDLAGRAIDRDDLVRRKNLEALSLLDRIGVPGTRLRGLASAAPDVVIDLGAPPPPTGTRSNPTPTDAAAGARSSAAATVICADVLLAALPLARVVVDDRHAGALAGDPRVSARSASADLLRAARVIVLAPHPLTVPRASRAAFAAQLQDAVDVVGNGTLGWSRLIAASTAEPTAEIIVASQRAERRRSWRPQTHGFLTETTTAPLRALPAEPDLEAHLSGWAN